MAGIGIGILFLCVFLFQGVPLFKKKQWKDLAVFMTALLLGAYYSLGQVYRWPLPNPTERLEILSEPAWKALVKILS